MSVYDAYGRILFENVRSKCNVPPFRTSAKHGYAIKANDEINIKNILQEGSVSGNTYFTYTYVCHEQEL